MPLKWDYRWCVEKISNNISTHRRSLRTGKPKLTTLSFSFACKRAREACPRPTSRRCAACWIYSSAWTVSIWRRTDHVQELPQIIRTGKSRDGHFTYLFHQCHSSDMYLGKLLCTALLRIYNCWSYCLHLHFILFLTCVCVCGSQNKKLTLESSLRIPRASGPICKFSWPSRVHSLSAPWQTKVRQNKLFDRFRGSKVVDMENSIAV